MKQARLPENQFSVQYLGRAFCFSNQNALQQLYLQSEAAPLSARLLGFGITPEPASALACNCALLFQTLCGRDALSSPDQALCRFSMGQIADLCALYGEHARTIRGSADSLNDGWDEGGINERFSAEVS